MEEMAMGEMRVWRWWPKPTGDDKDAFYGPPAVETAAEAMEISGGALVFRIGGEIVEAVGPGFWQSVTALDAEESRAWIGRQGDES
jgi:hypothetical protein